MYVGSAPRPELYPRRLPSPMYLEIAFRIPVHPPESMMLYRLSRFRTWIEPNADLWHCRACIWTRERLVAASAYAQDQVCGGTPPCGTGLPWGLPCIARVEVRAESVQRPVSWVFPVTQLVCADAELLEDLHSPVAVFEVEPVHRADIHHILRLSNYILSVCSVLSVGHVVHVCAHSKALRLREEGNACMLRELGFRWRGCIGKTERVQQA